MTGATLDLLSSATQKLDLLRYRWLNGRFEKVIGQSLESPKVACCWHVASSRGRCGQVAKEVKEGSLIFNCRQNRRVLASDSECRPEQKRIGWWWSGLVEWLLEECRRREREIWSRARICGRRLGAGSQARNAKQPRHPQKSGAGLRKSGANSFRLARSIHSLGALCLYL